MAETIHRVSTKEAGANRLAGFRWNNLSSNLYSGHLLQGIQTVSALLNHFELGKVFVTKMMGWSHFSWPNDFVRVLVSFRGHLLYLYPLSLLTALQNLLTRFAAVAKYIYI